jgi:hypothetical protein
MRSEPKSECRSDLVTFASHRNDENPLSTANLLLTVNPKNRVIHLSIENQTVMRAVEFVVNQRAKASQQISENRPDCVSLARHENQDESASHMTFENHPR